MTVFPTTPCSPGCLYPFICRPVSIGGGLPFCEPRSHALGMIILLPIMLIYNAYQFSVFWGKAEEARYEN